VAVNLTNALNDSAAEQRREGHSFA
jgi:hypothetical protein